jgi:hypothetical protein
MYVEIHMKAARIEWEDGVSIGRELVSKTDECRNPSIRLLCV